MSIWAIVVLAAGTFAMRFAGPALRNRVTLSQRTQILLKRCASVLLIGLVATSTLMVDGQFGGWALPAGVAVGGVLAWRKAPFVIVVLGAAVMTAVLRLVGVA